MNGNAQIFRKLQYIEIGFRGIQGQAVAILYFLSLAQGWAESTEWCDWSI